jgi:drug/metabolite transporter (DMT)-like permease|tara:strand:+ start:3863 stop:4312 length:450 start_codon:yes stop_codon:yes gene_type:complete
MDTSTTDLAQIIQIVVAPVFMLTGIAGFLNVMSGRLGRIVDRARIIERRIMMLKNPAYLEMSQKELKNLWRRVNLINRAIGLCVASALFVCGVVVCLFVGDLWQINFRNAVIALFTISLILLIFALLTFLKEVQLATRNLQIGKEFIEE